MKEQVKSNSTNPFREDSCTTAGNEFTTYYRKANSYPTLSAEEEKDIAIRAKQGDLQAKKILVQANLKLVLTVARKVIHVSKLPLTDLIQEGNLGLITAV